METGAARPMVSTDRGKLALAVAVGACAGNAGALISTFRSHLWLLDGRGKPVPEDFVAFWAAGRQAIAGHAVAAYDGGLQHAAEVAAVGHSFSETLGWSYPPVFLVFAALLATLPYTPAFLLWMGATVAGYGGVIASIVKSRWGFLFACAAPWMVTAILPGQNGFLTAALIGASLLSLESSPSLSGLLIGLASYKPQFAFLFLAVLASAGYWRAFAVACAAAIAANVFAEVLFGFDTFHAFFNALAGAAQSHLVHAGVGWNKLQSAYGFMRRSDLLAGASPLLPQGSPVGVSCPARNALRIRLRPAGSGRCMRVSVSRPRIRPAGHRHAGRNRAVHFRISACCRSNRVLRQLDHSGNGSEACCRLEPYITTEIVLGSASSDFRSQARMSFIESLRKATFVSVERLKVWPVLFLAGVVVGLVYLVATLMA